MAWVDTPSFGTVDTLLGAVVVGPMQVSHVSEAHLHLRTVYEVMQRR